jgi:PPM family protein phosphatase
VAIVTHLQSTAGRRTTNQDRCCVERSSIGGRPALVLAVADGMGGLQSGDGAAECAIEHVRAFAQNILPRIPVGTTALRQAIRNMFQEANTRVWTFGQQQSLAGQVGTTLVCAVILEDAYVVGNTGDSRCYYVNDHEARLLTEDHSQVRELILSGAMTEEAGRKSPYRSQLTSSLGEPDSIRVDLFPTGDHVGVIDEGAALFLCSDGLHGEVSEADVFGQLQATRSLAEGCENLVSLASQRGSTDNITVAAAEIRALSRSRARTARGPAVGRPNGKEPSPTGGVGRLLRRRPVSLAAVALVATSLAVVGWAVVKPTRQRSSTPAPRPDAAPSAPAESLHRSSHELPEAGSASGTSAAVQRGPGERRSTAALGSRVANLPADTSSRPSVAGSPASHRPGNSVPKDESTAPPDAAGSPAPGTSRVGELSSVADGSPGIGSAARESKTPPASEAWRPDVMLMSEDRSRFRLVWSAFPAPRFSGTYDVTIFSDAAITSKVVALPRTEQLASRFEWPSGQHQASWPLFAKLVVFDDEGRQLESVVVPIRKTGKW